MRALLVVNPKATTTSERSRDVLVRALRSEVDLRVEVTRRRGHGADLARQAVAQGLDVVVVLGGDGTVNEVVNGLLTATAEGRGAAANRVRAATSTDIARTNGKANAGDKKNARRVIPAIAVVPGGSTNVFARALGMPKDAVEATGAILEAMHDGRARPVGLGKADGRYFTFCAGLGLDAEVVRKVERARLRGKDSTPGLYIRSTIAQFFLDTERRVPLITLERPGENAEVDLATVIVQNTAPWTYIGNRAVTACPDASFETGLDVMAMRALHIPATALAVTKILTGRRRKPDGRQTMTLHDLSAFTLSSARPLAFQVDGDYLGERTKVTFSAVPDALRVFC
jgi:diacylglycerol kinase family enzyme